MASSSRISQLLSRQSSSTDTSSPVRSPKDCGDSLDHSLPSLCSPFCVERRDVRQVDLRVQRILRPASFGIIVIVSVVAVLMTMRMIMPVRFV